jgi:hypothetical protein
VYLTCFASRQESFSSHSLLYHESFITFFETLPQVMKEAYNEEMLLKIRKSMDSDKDGKVSRNEFISGFIAANETAMQGVNVKLAVTLQPIIQEA